MKDISDEQLLEQLTGDMDEVLHGYCSPESIKMDREKGKITFEFDFFYVEEDNLWTMFPY